METYCLGAGNFFILCIHVFGSDFLLYVSKSSDFWVCPLILNSHSIRSGISKIHSTPSRCAISTCVLHSSYLFIWNFSVFILHICPTFEGYCC